MMFDILRFTPTWVWGLLAALVALGLNQTRQRRVARAQLLALPLVMLAMGLWTLAAGFAAQPLTAAAWLLGLAGFGALGLRLPRPAAARWLPEPGRLQLPGSWWPLGLILTIFCLRYVSTVSLMLHPDWRHALNVQLPLAATFGALSGLFCGRALGLLQLTRQAPATTPATIERDANLRGA